MKSQNKRKILKYSCVGLITSALIGGTIASILTSERSYVGGVEDITFYSNLPIYRDKGFNELTYNGVSDYSIYKNEELNERSMIGVTGSGSYSDDGSGYVSEIIDLYNSGVEAIVSSGFSVAQAFTMNTEYGGSYEGVYQKGFNDKTAIVMDDTSLANYENGIAVHFSSNEAAFAAAISASIYASYLSHTKPSEYDSQIVVWGGQKFSTVFDFLSGFEQGVNWFNYQILGYDIHGHTIDNSDNSMVEVSTIDELLLDNHNTLNLQQYGYDRVLINNGGETYAGGENYSYSGPIDETTKNDFIGVQDVNPNHSWYTGGFMGDKADGLSGSNALVKINNAKGNKTSVIFPVAGGQTTETLSELGDNDIKVIGVDSDAVISNPTYSERILGSAIKNISYATEMSLWYYDQEPESDDYVKADDPMMDVTKHNSTTAVNSNNGLDYNDLSDGEEFIMDYSEGGWNESNELGTTGHLFKGTYYNGGVGFTDGGQPFLEDSLDEIIKTLELGEGVDINFDNILNIAFAANPNIEVSSNTFSTQDGGVWVPAHSTESEEYPWIPNWEVYV